MYDEIFEVLLGGPKRRHVNCKPAVDGINVCVPCNCSVYRCTKSISKEGKRLVSP